MPLHRLAWALAATLAAACAFTAAPSRGSTVACRSAYSYAGLFGPRRTYGIGAVVTPVTAPRVAEGHVAGWVGVGGPGLGPHGTDEWIQVGLSAFPDGTSSMYYEVKQPGYDAKYVELRAHVAPGERHRVAVLQVHGRPDVWRVWVDGHAASIPYYLPDTDSGWQPQATAESWNGGQPICNGYRYAFSRISVARAPGGAWTRFHGGQAFHDPGYRMLWRTPASFVALGAA